MNVWIVKKTHSNIFCSQCLLTGKCISSLPGFATNVISIPEQQYTTWQVQNTQEVNYKHLSSTTGKNVPKARVDNSISTFNHYTKTILAVHFAGKN